MMAMVRKTTHIIPALLAGLLCVAGPAIAKDLSGQVSRVHDGDTLTLSGTKIRLWGIDAPELAQQCRIAAGKTACGKTARDALHAMVRGRRVICTEIDRDRYKRVVASCQAGGRDLGDAMVRAGYALDYRQYSRGRYRDAERAAKAQRAGMWSGEFDKPWDYRRR